MPWPFATNFIGKSVGKICRKSIGKSIMETSTGKLIGNL